MAGRKRKPTALHVVQGTARKDRANIDEPKPSPQKPRCPAHLPPKAKTAFKNVCELLEGMGVLTIVDGMALELLCDAYAEWRDLDTLIKKEGRTYKTISTSGDEIIKGHPAVAMRSDAWKRIKSMMVEFGLTAASRTKVNAEKPEEADPLDEYMKRRR